MSLGLYMDVHVPAGITRALLPRRGVDVPTAQEDNAARFPDPDRSIEPRALADCQFTRHSDFLAEGVRRQRAGLSFATIVYAHQQHVSIGRCVENLSLISLASTPDEATGQIVYLPL